jgi:hypothetical protein
MPEQRAAVRRRALSLCGVAASLVFAFLPRQAIPAEPQPAAAQPLSGGYSLSERSLAPEYTSVSAAGRRTEESS